MDTPSPQAVAVPEGTGALAPEEQLSDLFSYRAEWLGEKLFELFTEPSFFPELKTARPCMIVGGRGTGKTTILSCLAYEGQFALSGRQSTAIADWPFFGLYYRVNTNRINAFKGPELDEELWIRHFAHYVNLELCDLLLTFLLWFNDHHPDANQLSENSCRAVARSLNLPSCDTLPELSRAIFDSRVLFEAALNNIADEGSIRGLSLQGAPIDLLVKDIRTLPEFRNKLFFFLIDEYENYLPYQQQVLNTLVKHTTNRQGYTFKIGIRELGLRRRTTLNPDEQLVSPADYVLIPITEKLGDRFPEFAEKVCNERLKRLTLPEGLRPVDIRALLPELSEEEEALLLGVDDHLRGTRAIIMSEATSEELDTFDKLPPLFAYFLIYSAASVRRRPLDILREYILNPKRWESRFSNYSHAILYTIRRGKRGIRKFYAGWSVLSKLAAGNIRYLLELVDNILLAQLRLDAELSEPISPKIQTEAAQRVGRQNLTELDGLSIHGAKLTKLLLGLGRVFQVMAANPEGHTPEANQFEISHSQAASERAHEDAENLDSVDELLQTAVRHLALVRFTGSKPQEEGDTKSFDYMIHPIFCPFFEFSYRRKRKITITPSDVTTLVTDPSRGIAEILRNQNRGFETELPEQLRLFEGFYAGHQ